MSVGILLVTHEDIGAQIVAVGQIVDGGNAIGNDNPTPAGMAG